VQGQQERQDEPGQTRNPPGTPVASRRPASSDHSGQVAQVNPHPVGVYPQSRYLTTPAAIGRRQSDILLAASNTVKSSPNIPNAAQRAQGFTMAMYESEITQFLKTLKQERPSLDAEQREGRALLWDKAPIDLEERARADASRVAQKPYVYASEN
jgi:hypothetical protein